MASWTAVFRDDLFHLFVSFSGDCILSPKWRWLHQYQAFAMNGYIHVCLKTTFAYKCCFQTNTVLPYFSISKEKHPRARRWKDKWSQISNDCLLLSLMWLNEYGVFVSSRALSDVVFPHWIWSFLLSIIMCKTCDDLVTLAWSRSSYIDLHL